jgi:hypothetical protein
MNSTQGTSTGEARKNPGLIDFRAVGLIVGGFGGIIVILLLLAWGYAASGLSGPDPMTIKAAIASNYDIQGVGWNGDGRSDGVSAFDPGTHAFEISVAGDVHICLANLEQAQARQSIICNDHFVVHPKR